MNFIEAVECMRKGKKVRRSNWKGFWTFQDSMLKASMGYSDLQSSNFMATDWTLEDAEWELIDKKVHITKSDVALPSDCVVGVEDVKLFVEKIKLDIEKFEKDTGLRGFSEDSITGIKDGLMNAKGFIMNRLGDL